MERERGKERGRERRGLREAEQARRLLGHGPPCYLEPPGWRFPTPSRGETHKEKEEEKRKAGDGTATGVGAPVGLLLARVAGLRFAFPPPFR